MRLKSGGALDGMAGVALVLYPAAGAGLLLIRGALLRRARPSLTWLLLWGGLLALGLLASVRESSYDLLLQAALGVVAGSFLLVPRLRALFTGLLVGIAVVLALGFAERERSRTLWNDAQTPQNFAALVTGRTELSGDSPGWKRNGIRLIEKRWLLGPNTRGLELSLEMRSPVGESGWQWYTNSPVTRQSRLQEQEASFTRVTGLENYVARRFRAPTSLGGKLVRASVELRSSEPITHNGCALQLRSFEPSLSTCAPLKLGTGWETHEITFQVPAGVPNTTFDLTLPALEIEHLDIRSVRVEVIDHGVGTPLEPLEPEGVLIRFPLSDLHLYSQPVLHAVPTEDWQRYTLSFRSDELASMREVTGLLQLEASKTVELRNVSLRTHDTDVPQPIPTPRPRSDLWFEQANLAGHTLGTVGLLALVLLPSSWTILTSFLLVLLVIGAVFLSGSRAAWLGTLLGGGWFLWLRSTPRQRTVLATFIIATTVAVTALGGHRALGRLQPANWAAENSITRLEIWEVAWNGMLRAPLRGYGENGFATAWREQRASEELAAPSHAHNLWLDFGVRYGLPGLAAVSWLTGGLLWLAWRRGRWRGVALVIPVLIMNMFDQTLFYAGVLYPLILGLNALRVDGREPLRFGTP